MLVSPHLVLVTHPDLLLGLTPLVDLTQTLKHWLVLVVSLLTMVVLDIKIQRLLLKHQYLMIGLHQI